MMARSPESCAVKRDILEDAVELFHEREIASTKERVENEDGRVGRKEEEDWTRLQVV